jgi:hypothetical protein
MKRTLIHICILFFEKYKLIFTCVALDLIQDWQFYLLPMFRTWTLYKFMKWCGPSDNDAFS